MKRKSQMEILGLAIVFVLIIVGFLLYLRFSSDKDSDPRENYLLPVKAQSIITAMVRTNTHCYADANDEGVSYTLSELLKDGLDLTRQDIRCYYDGDYEGEFDDDDGRILSSDYAKIQIDLLLSKTMEVWDEDYWYEIKVKDDIKLSGNRGSCDSSKNQRDRGIHTIELRTSVMEVEFGICA